MMTVDPVKLQRAKAVLEAAGYTVHLVPVELWQHRALLSAWHSETKEGFLIGSDELGLVCHYGVEYLDPYKYGRDQPRYKDADNPNRIRHYAEAILSRHIFEIESASPGTSNTTLNRSAFILGRYLFGWQLDPDSIQGQLLEAAIHRGIPEYEAKVVIRAGLKAGSKNPRNPDELLDELVGKPEQAKGDNFAAKHLAKLSRKLGGRP
jgi:hypothetical protein